ncbi:MAG: ATP-dependent nuclease, partial [Oliverpabstia sp.]
HPPVSVKVELEITKEDLYSFQRQGLVSRYRRFDAWLEDFCKKLPSYKEGVLSFTFMAKWSGERIYSDGIKKNNHYIREIFPQIYYIDVQRNLRQFQKDILLWMENDQIRQMRSDVCMFDRTKKCRHCFDCMGVISKKAAGELNALEAAKLLDYKLYQLNLDDFSAKMNENFRRNGGMEEIRYSMNRDVERMLEVTTETYDPGQNLTKPLEKMAKGMRSVYMLSLMETYAQGSGQTPGIIVVEEPELFLHPQMQKIAGQILYRLSKKNQIIFSTHSANLLSNFNTRQIRQMVLDENGCSCVRERTDISRILEDLGYTAVDLLNVNFVFIVEGKQDKSRLPILIRKYYAETYDQNGQLFRIAIINTNSCTNIKTYANLKYINQIYLKDQFLMIRDGDGKDRKELQHQLCRYYEERSREDMDALPRVRPQNVLVLRYYSFENYFLNPEIMVRVGVLKSEEQFYEILLKKWKEYLWKIKSGKHLTEIIGKNLETVEDIREHMEEIKIYLRGHNLFDIFYGRYKKNEKEILTKYIELASREEFADILDAIDSFIYFENRKK